MILVHGEAAKRGPEAFLSAEMLAGVSSLCYRLLDGT
jgi:hypothetical protein